MNEMKPCPFCGGTPVIITPDSGFQRLHRASRNGYCYYCPGCETLCGFDSDYGGVYKTAEEAAMAWNMRIDDNKVDDRGEIILE